MTFETDLHRAKGSGSAKKGRSHWIAQRVTAIALIPLSLWFVSTFIILISAPFEQVCFWLSSPWTVSLSILFMFVLFYHGALGMQVIWEDYIPHEGTRGGLVFATKFLSMLLVLIAGVCILKIYLTNTISISISILFS